MHDTPILLDVSRLIWRQWGDRIPTGIDRVCLAYLEHFRDRSRAVVQFRGFHHILAERDSARLFELLQHGMPHFRRDLVQILATSLLRGGKSVAGQLYLNVGHTGLDSPYLGPWIADEGIRPIYLVHDLIPITHPQYCRPGEANRHRQRMTNALATASGFIVNSHDTARELEHFAVRENLPLAPCITAWLGTEEIGTVNGRASANPYFVMVGTIEARKNHLLILEAWTDLVAKLGDRAPDLVIIGQRGWEAEEAIGRLENLGPLSGKVRELGRCSDAEMLEWIAGARALLMPSFVEGFGLPLIEALETGTPVIASNLGVFREIAGDLPRYLDPNDRSGWAEAVTSLTTDGAERRRQETLLKSFKPPQWSDHFRIVDRFLSTL